MLIRSVATIAVSAVLLLALPLAGSQATSAPDHPVVSQQLQGLPSAGASSQPSMGLQSATTLSDQVSTPIPFSMVGFEVPDGAEVEFRTSTDAKTWTDWTHAHRGEDEAPDPAEADTQTPAQERMSEPYWVDKASWLQVRVLGPAAPEDVAVHLIDSAGLSRGPIARAADAVRAAFRSTGQPAVATVGAPPVVTRAQWGADESLRKGNPSSARRARLGFVHHTVHSNSYSAASSPSIVRGIYEYHTKSRGWNDIGYNLLVDRFGTVFEGRFGGLEKAVIGAHAGGFNTGSFGVAIIGRFDDGSVPSAAARESLAKVLAWKFDVHHIDAAATVQVESLGSTRYAAGQKVTLATVSGHRDVSTTACPGGNLYSQLWLLRQRALELATSMFIDPGASPTSAVVPEDAAPPAITFSTKLKPAGSWSLEVRSPSGSVVHSASGSGSTASSTWQPPAGADYGRYDYRFTSSGRRPVNDYVNLVRPLVNVLERIGDRSDPVAAAVDVSKVAFPEEASALHAVLARADLFPDAMAGGPLAGADGPVLLTGGSALDSRVRAELDRVLPDGATVYVLGGAAALSDAVAAALGDRWEVVRLAGRERTETAAVIAAAVVERTGAKTALVARAGPDAISPWADALAGGAYGASRGMPVLLTYSDRLSAPAQAAVAQLGITRAIVLGGEAAVSAEAAALLPDVRRISGRDRSETAAAIASDLWGRKSGSAGDRFVVSGGYRSDAWALALAASPLAAQQGAPVLLAGADAVPAGTRDYLGGLGYGTQRMGAGWVLGPQSAIGKSAVDAISALLQ